MKPAIPSRSMPIFGLLLCLAFAGCFSERSVAGGPTDLCSGQPGGNVVLLRDFAFVPAEIRISAGTRVTWANCDTEFHTVTSDAGIWDSGAFAPEATFERSFDEPGQFTYHCQPHPFMTATIIVE